MATLVKCPVESLNKGLTLLEYIAKSPDGIGLTKLAERMNLKLTTTHNLVKTLHICGYVNKMDDGKYQVGWKLPSLTRPAMIQLDPEGPAVKALQKFAKIANESIVLTTLIAGERKVLLRIAGQQLIHINSEAMDSAKHTVWTVVTGQILAAYCSDEELIEIINNYGLPKNIKSIEALKKQLASIREQKQIERIENEIAATAMPIHLSSNKFFGSLGVHLPQYRYTKSNRNKILKAQKECCETLAKLLET